MSLSEYFTEAENAIAAETGGVDNVLYNGGTYTGVWGQPQVQDVMLPAGGFRKRTFIPLTITRDQFSTAPAARVKVTNPKLTPQKTYTVEKVNTDDPFHYVLEVIRVGE